MELPGVESPEMFTRDNIVALCTQSLRRIKDWRELIELQLSEGKELELAWRLGTQLDWVWLDTDVLGEPRECAVLCGLAMQQVTPSFSPNQIFCLLIPCRASLRQFWRCALRITPRSISF
jgi:hypothetical protein